MTISFFKSKSFIILLIIVLSVAAFFPIFSNGFINYDDPAYVTKNLQVQSGISLQTIKWAFTSTIESNWHPLTWISHAIDYSLFGLNPAYQHGMSLFIHLLSSIILFLVLERMTKKIWLSFFVAIVFAIHPLHVESVAWISERKDVLSGLFWILTIGAYVFYCDSPKTLRYIITLFMFALGLLAKPMLITLPFVLILLDYWPLKRIEFGAHSSSKDKRKKSFSLAKSFQEKIPFFILTVVSSIITYIVQQRGGSMAGAEALSFPVRMSNAIVSYLLYIWKTILPVDLAIFYPHPENTLTMLEIIFAAGVLILVSVFVWRMRIKYSYLVVGWLLFLGTLVPVIGIVQVGLQSMADRYMYLPIIGLAIMAGWGIPQLAARMRIPTMVIAGIVGIIIALMVFQTRTQAGYWKDSLTLFDHALSVTKNNHLADTNLGVALTDSGKIPDAILHLRKALSLRPNEILIRSDLARALVESRQFSEALEQYKFILPRVLPDPQLRRRMGDVLADMGKTEEAIPHYQEAVRLDTSDYFSRLKMAELYAEISKFEEARGQCRIVLARDPKNSRAHNILGIIAGRQLLNDDAIREFSEAIRLDSTNADAYNDFGVLYERMGKLTEAIEMYKKSIKVNQGQWSARLNLGVIFAGQGKYGEAETEWKQAIAANPINSDLHINLGRLYMMQNRSDEASQQFAEALQIDSNNVFTHYHFANLLMKEGRLGDAEAQYASAVRIDSTYRPAQEALRSLRIRLHR
jgi:protein O-mannosyl-transferase